jgi:hypothetical protein
VHFRINEELMTVFFFVVGLEIRREMHGRPVNCRAECGPGKRRERAVVSHHGTIDLHLAERRDQLPNHARAELQQSGCHFKVLMVASATFMSIRLAAIARDPPV